MSPISNDSQEIHSDHRDALYSRLVQNNVARIEEHLEAVGIDYSREGPIREFSRGMLQRLSLAKASIISWKLLLLDEPTTGLDSDGIELLSYMVESWKKEGRSLLVVSHDKLWISKYMDRVVVLENGEIN